MGVNYAIHEFEPPPLTEVRDRFVRVAMWNCTPANREAVRHAFDRLGVMLPGSSLNLSMYQSTPSGQRTVYALVLHEGPSADQRRYFRPDAIRYQAAWDVKRGRVIPVADVIAELREMERVCESA